MHFQKQIRGEGGGGGGRGGRGGGGGGDEVSKRRTREMIRYSNPGVELVAQSLLDSIITERESRVHKDPRDHTRTTQHC